MSHKITAERRQMIVNWVFKKGLCKTSINVSNKVLMKIYLDFTGNHAFKSNVCSCLWTYINKYSNFKGCKPVETKLKSKPKEKAKTDFYSSKRWKKLRVEAFIKYGRRCVLCGRTVQTDNDVVLTVDHIKPRSTHPELSYDIDNLMPLCSDCNEGKGSWCSIDFRIPEQSIDKKEDV